MRYHRMVGRGDGDPAPLRVGKEGAKEGEASAIKLIH